MTKQIAENYSVFPHTIKCGENELSTGGLSIRQYAAINLRATNSGDEWLDEMIKQSLLNEFAAKAMHQFLAGARLPPGVDFSDQFLMIADRSYEMAYYMMKSMDKK